MKRPLVSQLDPDYQALGQEGKLARIDSFNGARALSHALSSIGLSLEQLRVAQDLLARPLKQNELRIKHGNETCHESNARKLCLIFFCFWFSLVIMLGFPMIFLFGTLIMMPRAGSSTMCKPRGFREKCQSTCSSTRFQLSFLSQTRGQSTDHVSISWPTANINA